MSRRRVALVLGAVGTGAALLSPLVLAGVERRPVEVVDLRTPPESRPDEDGRIPRTPDVGDDAGPPVAGDDGDATDDDDVDDVEGDDGDDGYDRDDGDDGDADDQPRRPAEGDPDDDPDDADPEDETNGADPGDDGDGDPPGATNDDFVTDE